MVGYYCRMRLNILAFAAGVLLLQWQAELPVWGPWALCGALLLLPLVRWPNRAGRTLAMFGCLLLGFGFGFACWRAEIRLADELPLAWEGRDVEVIGVVAGLPQDFSHGTRFEFDLEKPLTATAGMTICRTPAATAATCTASRSASNSAASRWQCVSISITERESQAPGACR